MTRRFFTSLFSSVSLFGSTFKESYKTGTPFNGIIIIGGQKMPQGVKVEIFDEYKSSVRACETLVLDRPTFLPIDSTGTMHKIIITAPLKRLSLHDCIKNAIQNKRIL